MFRGFWLTIALVLTRAIPAVAQPTIWQRASDPAAQKAFDVLTMVERKLLEDDGERPDRTYREIVALLEENGATSLPDPRLRYLLADVYAETVIARYRDARRAAEQALAEAPNSPEAARGWFLLGIACAKLDDPDCENRSYSRALEVTVDRDFRANIYLNRGESNMVLGDLVAAVRDYRQAVRLARRMDLVSLAYYGLGIALERSGDLPSGLRAMRRARANWPALAPYTALDQPSVFFVPSYDIYYYKALERMALAQRARQDRDFEVEQAQLLEAIQHWSSYIAAAETSGSEYVTNARLHRQNCRRDLERSMARALRRLHERKSRGGD